MAWVVFEPTPLVVMWPGWWRVRRRRRDAWEARREAQRRACAEVVDPRLGSTPPMLR